MNEGMSIKGELRTRIHNKFGFNAFNLFNFHLVC